MLLLLITVTLFQQKLISKLLFIKKKVNEGSKQWINIIAAQKNWKKSKKAAAIKKLIKAYHTDAVKKLLKRLLKALMNLFGKSG